MSQQTKTPTRRRFVRTFKPQFAPAVRAGTKRQTIRPWPKRVPLPGDIIDCRMWTGRPYNSPQEKLGDHEITEARGCTIYGDYVKVFYRDGFECLMDDSKLNEFAAADGFPDWDTMRNWFSNEHGLPFPGVLIKW